MVRRPLTRQPLLALVALLVVVALGYGVQAAVDRGSGDASSNPSASSGASSLRTVDAASLPLPARQTITLISRGGPYPYSRDGIVFRDDENLLPAHESGWYHEYTVRTPGESDRGPRRIITGRDGSVYYTADHYASFVRVRGP